MIISISDYYKFEFSLQNNELCRFTHAKSFFVCHQYKILSTALRICMTYRGYALTFHNLPPLLHRNDTKRKQNVWGHSRIIYIGDKESEESLQLSGKNGLYRCAVNSRTLSYTGAEDNAPWNWSLEHERKCVGTKNEEIYRWDTSVVYVYRKQVSQVTAGNWLTDESSAVFLYCIRQTLRKSLFTFVPVTLSYIFENHITIIFLSLMSKAKLPLNVQI